MNIKEKIKIIYDCLKDNSIILPNGITVYIGGDDIIITSNGEYVSHFNNFYICGPEYTLINDIFYYAIIKFYSYEDVKKAIDISETDYVLERLKL
jgi:hypothetical protein